MRVIARIPDVSVPTGGASAPLPRPRERERKQAKSSGTARSAWPVWQAAALAVIAVTTWMLASWNDHARLRRQREAVRMACEPVTGSAAPVAAPAGGAVVR